MAAEDGLSPDAGKAEWDFPRVNLTLNSRVRVNPPNPLHRRRKRWRKMD